jgi:hypothetical protein
VSLEAINTWAQLIAAGGAIGSLFYLGLQIRQNTGSMRAIVVEWLAQSMADLVRPMAHDVVVMRAFAAAVADCTVRAKMTGHALCHCSLPPLSSSRNDHGAAAAPDG